MRQHITAVGLIHIGLGILVLLGAVLVVTFTVGPGLIATVVEGDALPLTILTLIGGSIGLLLALVALPGIVGGYGVIKHRPWARYVVMVLGVLNLFNVPVGTAIGIYTLWVLMENETEQLFTPGFSA